MAKVVLETSDRRLHGTYNWINIGLTGAALGVIALVLGWLLGTYVIDPLVCRSGALAACGQSAVTAGNVAAVIVAIIGAAMLIRLHVHWAVGVALAALASLWGAAALTDGLRWFEIAGWMAILYALAYLLFTNIFRIRSVIVAIIVAVLAVLVFRWVAFL